MAPSELDEGRGLDASLAIFAVLWGQLQAAHMLKDIQGHWWEMPHELAACLALTLPAACFGQGLLWAALGSGFHLWRHGSRSNHIMQDLIVNFAIVLAHIPEEKHYFRWRKQRMVTAVHRYLVSLYFVTALHKVNSDWFDPSISCGSSVAATLMAQYLPGSIAGSSLSASVLSAAPYAAVVIEALLPLLLWIAGPPPGRASTCRLVAIVLAAVFHLALALPLPPASFYPFSASSLALYTLQLPEAASSLMAWAPVVLRVTFPGLLLALCTGMNAAAPLSRWLRQAESEAKQFEYPAYDLYNAGVIWSLAVTVLILTLVLADKTQKSRSLHRSREAGCLPSAVVVLVTLFLGLSPYIGLRTYPAFAMFSNLRVEGAAPNHLLFGRGLDAFGFLQDTVHVVETNWSLVQNFQIDLAVLQTNRTLAFMQASGLNPALWISPPTWPYPPAGRMKPFSVPMIEFRRRVCEAYLFPDKEKPDRVGFARVLRGGKEVLVKGPSDLPHRACPGWSPAWLCESAKTYAGPFRSFDETASPCRH